MGREDKDFYFFFVCLPYSLICTDLLFSYYMHALLPLEIHLSMIHKHSLFYYFLLLHSMIHKHSYSGVVKNNNETNLQILIEMSKECCFVGKIFRYSKRNKVCDMIPDEQRSISL